MNLRDILHLVCACTLLSSVVVRAQGVTLPDFERIELDSGTVLLLHEQRDVPLVAITAILRGGAVSDPEGLNGLAALYAAMIEKGAGDRDAAQFAEAIDSAGGNLSASAGIEHVNQKVREDRFLLTMCTPQGYGADDCR